MKLRELYKEKIMGAIKGLDRIRFRGTLRWLANESGSKGKSVHINSERAKVRQCIDVGLKH